MLGADGRTGGRATTEVPMGAGQIRAEGRASRWAAADFADVVFTVAHQADTAAEAAEVAGQAYAALGIVLGEHPEVVVRRTTSSLSVQAVSHWEPETGLQVHDGYRASRTETVRFSPVADGRAGDALRAVLGAVPKLAVFGPAFGLDPANPVHDAVRGDAAVAALASVRSYAAGLGLGVGDVLDVREPGQGDPGGWAADAPAQQLRAMAKGGAGDPGDGSAVLVDLTSEDVEATAAVVLTVAIA